MVTYVTILPNHRRWQVADLWENPMGTDGFEFVEYAAPDPNALGALFETMGFERAAQHRSNDVRLYLQ